MIPFYIESMLLFGIQFKGDVIEHANSKCLRNKKKKYCHVELNNVIKIKKKMKEISEQKMIKICSFLLAIAFSVYECSTSIIIFFPCN